MRPGLKPSLGSGSQFRLSTTSVLPSLHGIKSLDTVTPAVVLILLRVVEGFWDSEEPGRIVAQPVVRLRVLLSPL